MEWTQDYFKKIRACLLEPKKDVGYSFIVDKDYSEDEAKFVIENQMIAFFNLF